MGFGKYPSLSDIAATSIIDPGNMVFVSAVSVWEIGIKKSLDKLEAPDNLLEEIELHRFTPLPINLDHAQLAGKLPNIHKDPFDRILIAQAINEKLTLVTRDQLIAEYNVRILGA
jgi:PIN domain nuclease of toxin-antitoxin system